MIGFRMRLAAGGCAAALFALACYLLAHAGRPVAAVLFGPAALLCLPLLASTRPPRPEEWEALDENVRRFRTAGLICFSFAVIINALGASERLAALGVAWWAVGFALIP